jgi:ABC-2 type transport system ATP-binding protein
VIEVKNVTKKYGSFVAVDDISFTINDGEVVGFLGPNGAGKSTTMNIITGFIEQTEGNVVINGFDTVKKAKKAKKEIGYMPEGVPLYTDLTVKEFVTYMAELRKISKKEKKENVQKVLKETGLEEMQNKLIKNLSRGQKQRVSLAGTLVANPKILILDEPTVGLDPKQITEIRSLIKNLGKSHTVILSSHILSEVSQICDRVIIINKGKIVAIDTPENLEKKVSNNNIIYVTVEDTENKIDTIKDKIKGIKEIKLIKENEDNTKQYEISGEESINLNKTIFSEFAKENITIFEMKKAEATLEDAFMKIIKEGGDK